MRQAIMETNAEEIVAALYNKSKRTFKGMNRRLIKQALSFSPSYRDFIIKILSNHSLKIKQKGRRGSILPTNSDGSSKMLNKRTKSFVEADINDADTLPHELGHAVDFWFGIDKALSSHVIIKNGKTLYDIFTKEFEVKHEEIFKVIIEEYKNIINSNINNQAFDILKNGMPLYEKLCKTPLNSKSIEVMKQRKRLHKELYESGFVEAYYLLVSKKCYSILNSKYGPVLDALSSKYRFDEMWLEHHPEEYYRNSKYRPVQEFFANLFMAKTTSKHTYFDNLIRFLPESFSAFESLFVMFYDHIQNNKRFTDVELKEASEEWITAC